MARKQRRTLRSSAGTAPPPVSQPFAVGSTPKTAKVLEPGSSSRTPRQTLVNNEQVKLSATTTNALAIAFMIGGGAGVYAAFGSSSDWTTAAMSIGRAIFWVGIGGVLHLIARRILRNLV